MYLQWYRDKGNGQEAADMTKAIQTMDYWPIARLYFSNKEDCDKQWKYLLNTFQVNAMTYIHC